MYRDRSGPTPAAPCLELCVFVSPPGSSPRGLSHPVSAQRVSCLRMLPAPVGRSGPSEPIQQGVASRECVGVDPGTGTWQVPAHRQQASARSLRRYGEIFRFRSGTAQPRVRMRIKGRWLACLSGAQGFT